MPRDGSGVYSKPANTSPSANDTIESAKFNTLMDDIATDLNTDRPVVAGGTGASSAADARTNLGLGSLATANNVNNDTWSGTDLSVVNGGTGASSLADGHVLLGSGTGAVTALDVTAKGSLLVGDGTTDPQALAVGTNDYVLTADNAQGTGVKWAEASSGTIVQVVGTQTGAVSTGTTTMPNDDTIPQKTEGNEFQTLAITPVSSGNDIYIEVEIALNHTSNGWMNVALFQDNTSNALAATNHYFAAAGTPTTISLRHKMAAGTTNATTFKVRAGSSSSGTTTFNGFGSVRRFGGVMSSATTIMEVTP